MSERQNLLQQIENFDPTEDDLFYDWFCKDGALRNKSRALMTKVKQIAASDKFDPTKVYTFFKNNCPVYGRLYDDFRICDIKTGNVLFCIVPRSGYSKDENGKRAQVFGPENDFEEPLVAGTWRDVRKFFNV